jgi:hypothetical protein
MASPKDKVQTVLNPITHKLDMVRIFNPDRIATHTLNPAGNPLVIYDPVSGLYMSMGPIVITDNNGNVVTN